VVFAAAPSPATRLRAQTGPARAQPVPPLVAIALHDLDFGTVLPGITSSVPIRNPRQTGLFEINGPAAASVRVEFLLPTSLVSGGGALLPVAFAYGDGFADLSHGFPPRGTLFDPHAPVVDALGPSGKLYVRMGGTVLPAHNQPGGRYSATITMTVYNLGS
jgi:hypothetical protein